MNRKCFKMRNLAIHTAGGHFDIGLWKFPINRNFHLVIDIDLNRFFCHCSKSVTNLALEDLCSGIVPGCKTTTSMAKIMAHMHLSFCGELPFHPHRRQPRMPHRRNRRQRVRQVSQQQRESQRCRLKLQSHLLVSLISPCLYISRFYSAFDALFVLQYFNFNQCPLATGCTGALDDILQAQVLSGI